MDTNAALRDVVKSVLVLEEEQTSDRLGIIVDGGDWGGTWALQVFCRGLVALGYRDFPVKLFAPVIVDWSGGKFSKSLHVQQGAYAYLSPAFSDYTQFLATYGDPGIEILWQEIRTWASDPKRLQRNYSVAYFQRLLYEEGMKHGNV